jgi:Flp pilus assembly protein TadG
MRSRFFSAFLASQSGAIAPLVAIALVALVAAGGLAWDVSRAYALRGELDSAVDAAALAGATQLDGQTGALSRARVAAKGALVQNAQRLGRTRETDVTIDDADITFLQNLTSRTPASSDANAQFIQINLTPRELGPITGALVRVSAFNVRAHAVAGYGSALCMVPPLLICNPNEATDLNFDGDNYTGKAFILTPPPGNSLAPGNFGFLRVGNGATAIKDAMGRNPPQTECFGEVAETEPGNIQSADDWFNTRFDIYRGSAGGQKNDPQFAPALNTMVGDKQNAGNASCTPNVPTPPNDCSDTTAAAAYGFPKDCGMTTGIGGGTWNVGKYFKSNHNSVTTPSSPTSISYVPPTLAGSQYAGSGWASYGPPAVAGATTPTRFQVYNWELAILSGAITVPGAFSGGQAVDPPSGNKDFARPACNRTNLTQASPDRRLISAVVVNCNADHIQGRSTVHIITNVDFFLIAPADSATIYGEFVRATPASYGAIAQATKHYWVRLYE